jgi:hypothetical protein
VFIETPSVVAAVTVQGDYARLVETKVRTFKTRRSMESGVAEMATEGFHVVSQSGELSANLWTTGYGRRQKVVVTFGKQPTAAAEAGPANVEAQVDAAIALLVKLGYTVTPPAAS